MRSLHVLFWVIIFTQGLFRILDISSAVYKVGVPIIALILLLYKFYNKSLTVIPFVGNILLLILVSFISFAIHENTIFQFVYFIFYVLLFYFYFIIISNEKSIKTLRVVFITIVILFLIQIPASWIKYALIGQSEKGGIGTVSISGGSISTILPSFATVFLFSLYFFRRKMIYLILIAFYFMFGIIGEKRAISIYIPLMIVLVYIIGTFKKGDLISSKTLKPLLLTSLLTVIIFYFSVRLNPTLNPDNKIGGQFDLEYFSNYVSDYNKIEKREQEEMQRFEGLIYFSNYLYEKGLKSFLFGDGPGYLVDSKYVTGDDDNLMLKYYGVRYGGRMGLIWLYLQIGFLGVLFYLLFIFKLFIFVWKNYKPNAIYLFFLASTLLFLIDFTTYSYEFSRQGFLIGVYLFFAALIILDIKFGNIISKVIPEAANP